MRYVVPLLSFALCAVGCSDDSNGPAHVGIDAGRSDGGSDPGQLDAQAQLDAGLGRADGALADHLVIDPACVGSDQFEPNDAADASAPLPLGLGGSATFRAGVTQSNPDWFTFVTPKSDPVSVSAPYTVDKGSAVNLSLFVDDALGSEVASDTRARDGLSQTLRVLFESVAGAQYFLDIENSQDGCVAYQATVSANACTDSFEDNDTSASAAMLPSGAVIATASALEKDFYLPTAGASTCTVQYSVAAASSQQLSVSLLDATASVLKTDATARSGLTQTLSVTWTDSDPVATLVVEASDPECTSYTLTCR